MSATSSTAGDSARRADRGDRRRSLVALLGGWRLRPGTRRWSMADSPLESAWGNMLPMSQANPMRPAAFMTRPGREFGKPVCRLGLASHGRTGITAGDVLHAVAHGINFLNWSGFAEGPPDDEAFPAAVASLGRERDRVAVCVQFAARTAGEAATELRSV